MRALLAISVAAAGLAAIAAADPPAPQGWTMTEGDSRSVYFARASPAVELRLYPADKDSRALEDWLSARKKRGVEGLGSISYGDTKPAADGALMAVGLTGSGVSARFVMALACARADGSKRFAELILPQDVDLVQAYAEPASRILAEACVQPASAAAAPAKPAIAASVPATKPSPVPAGAAISDADVEGVLYSWTQTWEVTGLQYNDRTFLLLKDGTARDGVPEAALDMFDARADRRTNPESWGTWKSNGKSYLVNFGEGFDAPPGQLLRVKGKRGERLHNTFEWASSASIGEYAAWSNWGLKLNRDGTFQRWRSSGAGGGSGGTDGTFGMVVGDDKGSSSSTSARGVFSGGGTRTTGVTDDDLEGEYYIDGWTLELRYRNGTVQRNFFFTNEDRTDLWFEGHELFVRKTD